ncbi:MAG: outer membrane protein assembly factor BamC [Gammaproteobacteria bacterium]|jgi:outer membrane protein assembly factor BamC|nr:hypothetical protein [Gammaproteobacteria bacterium]MDP6096529.1 outer membrane protein assembly factor BamC [Gammaproteobacteria bacterium]|tara:strand:+ start:138 stop:1199 length:1062 start_codon:yes stop_codon:yes gene_type:complete
MQKIFITIFLVAFLSGCNYLTGDDGMFRDRGGDYLEAAVIPDMAIPNELDSFTLDQLYVIPEQLAIVVEEFDGTPRPRPLAARMQEGVRIQSFAERSWIVIDATPSQVWPLVRDYWTELQINLDYENPIEGTLETAWLEVDNETAIRNKYRLTIEPGLHSGYSEIYVLHLALSRQEEIPASIDWPEASNSADQEDRVMTSMSQYLADRNDIYQASSSSLLAGSIAAASKANFIEDDQGKRILELRMGYDRAWALVGTALETAEIAILDINREESVFSVQYSGVNEEDDGPGFIRRVFSFGLGSSDEEVVGLDFRVLLQETESSINVIAETLESEDEDDRIRNSLLVAINNNLN